MPPLLEISGLSVDFDSPQGPLCAVDGLSLRIREGERLGLAGESGCGKSATALAVMGLLPRPGGRIRAGSIRLCGRELTVLGEREYRRVRGRDMAMIFQNPTEALNPVTTVGRQITSVIMRQRGLTRLRARDHALAMLERMAIAQPDERMGSYPHQLSVGMRQRVVIAMALACRPRLIIADEPTTALDPPTESRILDRMLDSCDEQGIALLIVSHDFGVIARTSDRTAVMYCGQLVEQAGTETLFQRPRHPYTAGLLAAVPDPDRSPGGRLTDIPGQVPAAAELPDGCRFAPRCFARRVRCERDCPPLVNDGNRQFRCYYPLSSRKQS